VQGGGSIADGYGVSGSDMFGDSILKHRNGRTGGQPGGTQHVDHRLNVCLTDFLAAVRNILIIHVQTVLSVRKGFLLRTMCLFSMGFVSICHYFVTKIEKTAAAGEKLKI
jgi:hypothetical protein